MTEFACTIVVHVIAPSEAGARAKLASGPLWRSRSALEIVSIEPVHQQHDQAAGVDSLSVDRGG